MNVLTFIRLLAASIAWMVIVSLQAQSIRVADKEGRGIPYAMVLNTKGDIIGTTDVTGILANIGGTSEVLITHLAYKPQQVIISSLKDGNITMEDYDYYLPEAIPGKPSFYAETYYRAYTFSYGKLIHYTAGIMPIACNLKNGKITTGSHKDSRGTFYRSSVDKLFVSMNVMRYFNNHFSRFSFIVPALLKNKKMLEDHSIEVNEDEKGGMCFYTNKGMVAYTIQENNNALISANMIKLFGNKAVTTGQGTMAQMIQTSTEHKDINKHYIALLDDNSTTNGNNIKMFSNHFWGKTGISYVEHFDFIVETYIVKQDYIDSKEFKNKEKQLKFLYKAPMSLDDLEGYATKHNIPTLAPTLRHAIEKLKME